MIARNDIHPNLPSPRFQLGQLVATPGALKALEEAGQDPMALFYRHQRGEWGEVPADDVAENERSVAQGYRVMSVYTLKTNVKVWVITEADRSVTTILLPDEY